MNGEKRHLMKETRKSKNLFCGINGYGLAKETKNEEINKLENCFLLWVLREECVCSEFIFVNVLCLQVGMFNYKTTHGK